MAVDGRSVCGCTPSGPSMPVVATRSHVVARGQLSVDETERQRLAELHRLNVLDTPTEPRFDAITELASQIFNVPIALVSLVDQSRQWWKAKVGLTACETPREISFCTHAIRGSDVFVVHDALTHSRFASNPLVTGEPFIRFYAGAPLVTRGGFRVGTLCVIDRKPRADFQESDSWRLEHLAGLVVDLLERRQVEAALTEALHRLDTVRLSQARFLATASHEIRTPLSAISSLADLAYAKSDSAEQRTYLGKIRSTNRILLELLDDVLDVSRVEMSKIDRRNVVFNPYDVLDRVVEISGVRADVRNLQLAAQVAHDVPDRLTGDETRLFQILLNLVNNAIKFTDQGSVDIAVRVKARTADSIRLLFSVHDTGVGIPEDRLDVIFRELERCDDGPAPRGSAGLGLAIVRRFVALMGGTVTVRSTVGHGSTFAFDAEFGLTSSAARESPHAPLDPAPERGALEGLRVLLVDDSDLGREAVRGLLEYAGATVEAVSSGEAAVEIVTERPAGCDVVLMDLGLPGIDGLQATRLIRRVRGPGALPIVGFSATDSRSTEADCLGVGMNAFLRKPASWLELSDTIVAAVGRGEAAGKRRTDPPSVVHGIPSGDVAGRPTPEQLAENLSGMFRERYRGSVTYLRSTLDSGEYSKTESYLHMMRGAASLIGVPTVAAAAKSLETAVRRRSSSQIASALATFERELSQWLAATAEPAPAGSRETGSSGQAGSGTNR